MYAHESVGISLSEDGGDDQECGVHAFLSLIFHLPERRRLGFVWLVDRRLFRFGKFTFLISTIIIPNELQFLTHPS